MWLGFHGNIQLDLYGNSVRRVHAYHRLTVLCLYVVKQLTVKVLNTINIKMRGRVDKALLA